MQTKEFSYIPDIVLNILQKFCKAKLHVMPNFDTGMSKYTTTHVRLRIHFWLQSL